MNDSKFHTMCMKSPGSFPSSLLDTHPIWSNITCTVSIVGETTTPTIEENWTAATVTSWLIVDGYNTHLVQKTQATFARIFKTVTDPDLAACFKQFTKTWGDLE